MKRERIIEALKICDSNYDGVVCKKCPIKDEDYNGSWYDKDGDCYQHLMREAAELLSEQSAIQPEERTKKRTETHAESHACVSISRQDAIDALKICDNNDDGINCYKCPVRDKRWDGAWKDEETHCYKKLMRDSAELLSAQPERKTGYWIEASVAGMPALYHEKCGAFVYAPNGKKGFNFCPNCGEDMRGEQE